MLLVLDQNVDKDSAASVGAMVVLGTLVVTVLFAAPVLIGGMVVELGFTESQAGFIISAELLAMAIATLPALYLASRVNWRVLILCAALWMIAGNLLCWTLHDQYIRLLILRFAVGLAQGIAMCLCLAMIGLTGMPDRNFGLYVTGQLIFGALALFTLPLLMPGLGFGSVYLIVAVLLVSLLFLIRYLPQAFPPNSDIVSTQTPLVNSVLLTCGLLAILIYYIGQYGVWAYLDRIGASLGFVPETIGKALSFATVVGIAGALGPVALDKRFGRIWPIALGCAASVAAMLLLIFRANLAEYVIAAAVFSFMFNFVLPYLMAVIVSVDHTGKLIMLANIASGVGLAGGPALAALLLDHQAGFNSVISVGIGLTVISLLMIGPIAVPRNRA